MSQFHDVQAFVREANRITEMADLQPLLEDALKALGFDKYAFTHHVPGFVVPNNVIRLSNYPDRWLNTFIKRNYFVDDPVFAACQRSSAGFVWSQLPQILNLTDRQREIMGEWGQYGFAEGFTVPVHIPGEAIGSCSMSVSDVTRFPLQALPAAQYVASFAFEAARRVVKREWVGTGKASNRASLTARQFDCLVLVGRGKSDWDISRILGISDQTVHQHVEAAKKRYGVASRTQLVVRALFDSQLTFSDLFDLGHIP